VNPEDELPIGIRLSLAFLRFLRLALVMAVVCSLLGGALGAWMLGIGGETVQDGLISVLVGVGGLLASNVFHAATLFVDVLVEQIQLPHRPGDAGDSPTLSSIAIRDFMAFSEVSVLFVFAVQALFTGCMALAHGFNECKAWALVSSLVLIILSVLAFRSAKRRLGIQAPKS